MTALQRVMDACDVETFLICSSADEGKKLGLQLMGELGFKDADIVSCEMSGPGARVRLRGYVNRPGSTYSWSKAGAVR